MKKFKTFIWLCIMLMVFVGGFYNCYRYLSGTESSEKEERIENLKALIEKGVKTTAVYADEYTQTEVKGVEVGNISIEYSFEIDGQTYGNSVSLKNPPSVPVTEVYYLESDPSINSLDPQYNLEKANEEKGSMSSLWWGLGFIVVGGIGSFINFNSLRSPKKEEEA